MDVDTQLKGPPRVPKPHDFLWFPDGNVVLATDTYLFKVHKSLLAVHSSVFKDMFELPNVGNDSSNPEGPGRSDAGEASELYEGVPMVTLAGDKGEDVAHLLRAVFEPDYYHRDNDNTPLEVIVALLLLSTKYDFRVVRKSVILHISRHYPTTLQEYDALYVSKAPMFGRKKNACHFPLLAAAVTADVEVLLPGLFLACSDLGIREIFTKTQSMTRETLFILMEGKESMAYAKSELLSSVSEQLRSYDASDECQKKIPCLKDAYVRGIEDLAVLSFFGDVIGKEAARNYFSPLCKRCSSIVARMIDEKRKEIWDDVPSLFNIEPWEALQAKLMAMAES